MFFTFLFGYAVFGTSLFFPVSTNFLMSDMFTASDKTCYESTRNIYDANFSRTDTIDTKSLKAAIDSLNAAIDTLHLATEADKKNCTNNDLVDKEVYVDIKDLQRKVIYPDFAKRMQIEGKVSIRVLIGEDGIPKKYFIVSTDSPLLNNAAVWAVMNALFTPAILNKQYVCCWVDMPIVFRLR